MKRVVYSSRAEDDFLELAVYGLEQFGILQVDRYVDQIERTCQRLAEFPALGRSTYAGALRFEEGSHVIFYRSVGKDIVISRIHKSCDPAQHVL